MNNIYRKFPKNNWKASRPPSAYAENDGMNSFCAMSIRASVPQWTSARCGKRSES